MIFTILVSFLWDNALFASKAKINVFRNFFEWSAPLAGGAINLKTIAPKEIFWQRLEKP